MKLFRITELNIGTTEAEFSLEIYHNKEMNTLQLEVTDLSDPDNCIPFYIDEDNLQEFMDFTEEIADKMQEIIEEGKI